MGTSEKSLSREGSHAAVHAVVEVPSEGEWTPEFERKVVRKIDRFLMPMIWVMNIMSWMDRANLGNANIAGLTSDLKLSSNQFSLAIITFYFGYIAWVPMSTIILARTRPSIYLATIMGLWGVVTAATSTITTFPQLLVVRLFLGALESGLTPGSCYIFSCWYLPTELGKRASVFLSSAQLGGAFGGLVAGGVMSNLEGARGLRGWRWLFIVEGAITVVVAITAFFVLPDFPASSKKLTEEERYVAVTRLSRANIMIDHKGAKPRLTWWETMKFSVRQWRAWAIALASGFVSAALAMVYFYPALVRGLGYSNPITAQYMTVPIWVISFIFTMASGVLGDHFPPFRGLVVAGGLAITTIFSIVMTAVYGFAPRYAFLALMTGGVWVSLAQCTAYIGQLFGSVPYEIRAFTIGMMSCAANTGNVYGAYLFPAENAPKHILGFSMTAGTSFVAMLIFAFLWYTEPKKPDTENEEA